MGFDTGGASSGASLGGGFGPWGALAGGILGGFLGGGPKLPQEIKNLYRLQYGLASQMRDQSNSIPLSLPQEQAALASQRALGGEQFNNQTANLYNAWNQNTATGGATADLLQNNANAFQGFQSSVSAEHLLAALNRRQQMKLQASQIAGNAAGGVKDYQQPPDFAALFGNVARLHAQQQGQAGYGPASRGGGGNVDDDIGPGWTTNVNNSGGTTGTPIDWRAIAAQGGF